MIKKTTSHQNYILTQGITSTKFKQGHYAGQLDKKEMCTKRVVT